MKVALKEIQQHQVETSRDEDLLLCSIVKGSKKRIYISEQYNIQLRGEAPLRTKQ